MFNSFDSLEVTVKQHKYMNLASHSFKVIKLPPVKTQIAIRSGKAFIIQLEQSRKYITKTLMLQITD
jgi:hypothetical protein